MNGTCGIAPLVSPLQGFCVESNRTQGVTSRLRRCAVPWADMFGPRCGRGIRAENSSVSYIHVDIEPGEGIDIAYDLNKMSWPWDDDSADIIVAFGDRRSRSGAWERGQDTLKP